MSFISTKFTYKNISSDDMNVMLIHTETNLLKRPFGLNKTINSEKTRFRDAPVYYNTEKQVYTLPISIIKKDFTPLTQDERIKIAQWLFGDHDFHPFVSDDYPDLIWYLQFTKGEFNDDYRGGGYIALENQLSYPYAYTFPTIIENDCTQSDTTIIEIENKSNVGTYYYPKFQADMVSGQTSLTIKNLTVNGEETTFTNLTSGESIAVDNANQIITSSTGDERISNFNMQFLRLAYGKNRLKVTGKCWLYFKVQFPIIL